MRIGLSRRHNREEILPPALATQKNPRAHEGEVWMARLINPVLFSQRFNASPSQLQQAGLLDPVLNSDTKLFIDPLLLSTSQNQRIANNAFSLLRQRFDEVIRLVAASKQVGDKAWRTAAQRLDLSERPETGLGYGGASTSGASRPSDVKQKVLATAKEIVELGERDPEIISLMGLFEDGVGPDTISDLTTNAILPILCEITEEFCRSESISTEVFERYYNAHLPRNPFNQAMPVLLVPQDILRDLPLANDWSDVSRVVLEVEEIRESFNRMIGPIAQATLADKKRAIRQAALASLAAFRTIFEAVVGSSDNYDPNEDILNFYAFRKLISSDLSAFSGAIEPPAGHSKEELARIVQDIIFHFRHLVERNNLWELLWTDGRPKRERAAQLLFFAVSDVFCKANNVDISPETHSGGGPVDFKFSTGYENRVVVEVKRSTGSVAHGYAKQLEVYKEAARTDAAIFLIIDVGNLENKLKVIHALRREKVAVGERPSQIEVVDAKPKVSASKA